MNKVSALILKG